MKKVEQQAVANYWSFTIELPLPHKPLLYMSAVKAFENTVGKGEIACNEKFLLFPQCFLKGFIQQLHEKKIGQQSSILLVVYD